MGENVEVVRRMYDSFHGGDVEGALACYHADVVADTTRNIDGAIGHGREELAGIIARWIGAFDEWHEDIEEIRDLGGHVLVVATQRGRGRGSGIQTESRYALLYEVRDGAITRMTIYPEPAEALEAARAAGAPGAPGD